MKILLIIPTLGLGGAQRILVGLANRLARDKHETTILTFSSAESNHFYRPDDSVAVEFIGTIKGHTARHPRVIKTPFKVKRFVKQWSPDIILSFQDIANFATLLATRGTVTPVTVSERQDIRFYRYPALRRWARKLLYGHAHRIVVQTELIRQLFLAENLSPVTIIPNHIPATNLATAATASRHEMLTVICAGRLEPQKDFSLVIEAYASVPELRNHCTVKIFGDGTMKAELEARILQLKLERFITLEGTSDNLQQELSTADLFLLSSRYEGFPNVLAEAVSAALPCIAFRSVSGVSELIENGKNGVVIDDDTRSSEKLGQVLLSLVRDSKMRQNMSRESLLLASRFSEEAIYQSWKEVLSIS